MNNTIRDDNFQNVGTGARKRRIKTLFPALFLLYLHFQSLSNPRGYDILIDRTLQSAIMLNYLYADLEYLYAALEGRCADLEIVCSYGVF